MGRAHFWKRALGDLDEMDEEPESAAIPALHRGTVGLPFSRCSRIQLRKQSQGCRRDQNALEGEREGGGGGDQAMFKASVLGLPHTHRLKNNTRTHLGL